jgi:predicted nuclease with TOPRIM domain
MDSQDIALIVKARVYLSKDKYDTYEFKSFSSVIILENIKKQVIDKYSIKKNVENLIIIAGNNRNEKIKCDDDIIKNSDDYNGDLLCNISILLYEEHKENEKEKPEIDDTKDILDENKRLKEEIEKLKKEKEIIENQKNNISKEYNELKEKYLIKINKNKELKNEMEGIMTVNFISYDESIFCSIPCRNTYKFDNIVKKFCEMNPEYKEFKNYIFYIKGSRLDKNKSLGENKINNNSLITFKEN